MSVRSVVQSTVSLLTFCLDDLSSVENRVLKSPTTVILLFISIFGSVSVCFNLVALMLDV